MGFVSHPPAGRWAVAAAFELAPEFGMCPRPVLTGPFRVEERQGHRPHVAPHRFNFFMGKDSRCAEPTADGGCRRTDGGCRRTDGGWGQPTKN